jgi:hypothetical protein
MWMDDEEYDYYLARRSSDSAFELIGFVLKVSMYAVYYGVLTTGYALYHLLLHSPIVLAAYWGGVLLEAPLSKVVAQPFWLQLGAGGVIAYLTQAFIYFIKGNVQRLRLDRKYTWWLLLTICTLTICLIPAWGVWATLKYYFGHIQEVRVFGPLAVPVVAGLVYTRYKFHKDACPAPVYWAYRLGVHTSKLAQTVFYIP